MLLFATGTTPGVGAKSMVFLEPTAASTVTTVAAPDACAGDVLDFQATLGQPMPIPAADSTKWHVDWSQITKDSFGNPVRLHARSTRCWSASTRGRPPADLQTNFKDIEQIATTLYEVAGRPPARATSTLGDAKVTRRHDAVPGLHADRRRLGDGRHAAASARSPRRSLLTILQPQ